MQKWQYWSPGKACDLTWVSDRSAAVTARIRSAYMYCWSRFADRSKVIYPPRKQGTSEALHQNNDQFEMTTRIQLWYHSSASTTSLVNPFNANVQKCNALFENGEKQGIKISHSFIWALLIVCLLSILLANTILFA